MESEIPRRRQRARDDAEAARERAGGGRRYLRRLAVKSGASVLFLRTDEVDWFEASGNYVTIRAGNEVHLLRETMNALEAKLDPEQFLRIHRSAIVNLDRVKELRPWFRGERVLLLGNGVQLTVGRAYRKKLRRLTDNAI